jgi:GH18 family chitinase
MNLNKLPLRATSFIFHHFISLNMKISAYKCKTWIIITFESSCADVNSHSKVVVCYVNSWAAKNPGNGKFLVENIDPMLCTHIIYAYAGLDNVTHSIQSRNAFLSDAEEDGGKGK